MTLGSQKKNFVLLLEFPLIRACEWSVVTSIDGALVRDNVFKN